MSRTLGDAGWNNSTIIRGDVVKAVTELKERPGRDLQVHGSGDLAQTLIAHDLVDEYRLFVYPVLLGSGKRLFASGTSPAGLRLTDTKVTGAGVAVHTYERAGDLTYGSFALDR